MMNSALHIPQSALGSWLPDMDLNHDKLLQRQLCYRYTIGHGDAPDTLPALSAQSSQGLTATLRFTASSYCENTESGVMHVRADFPKARRMVLPLPRGEGRGEGKNANRTTQYQDSSAGSNSAFRTLQSPFN